MEKINNLISDMMSGLDTQKSFYLELCKLPSNIDIKEYAVQMASILERAKQEIDEKADEIDVYKKCEQMSTVMAQLLTAYFEADSTICQCGTKMEIIEETSEQRCPYCHRINSLSGIIFRKNQLHNGVNSNQQIKSNTYMPVKHFTDCMKYIQGTNDTEIPEILLIKLKKRLDRDKILTRQIDCATIRRYLSECGTIDVEKVLKSGAKKKKKERCTLYAISSPKIVWLITGVKPPKVESEEFYCILKKFNIIIDIYDRHIKTQFQKTNRPHYFYFIYKIIDQTMADGETKTKLLKNIYMQSDNTIRKNDIIFKKICEYIPKDINIIYKSTSLCR